MIDSGVIYNFITEAEAGRLRLRWEKDSRRMKAVNFIVLPIVGLVKRTTMKLGEWKDPVDFVVVKMDDFDVVLGMEFLLEHQVIPMPSVECLVITRSFPTVVQVDIRQPSGFKMISVMQLDKNLAQGEPTSMAILLEALGKLGKTVSKDTLCVPEKYHGVMPNSWPKSLSTRKTIDHGTKAPAKSVYRMAPPELAKLQKQPKKLWSTGFSRSVQASYGARVLSLKKNDINLIRCMDRRIPNKLTVSHKYPLHILTNLFDRSRGVKYFSKSDIQPRILKSVAELRSYPELTNDNKQFVEGFLKRASLWTKLSKKDIQWGRNLECLAASDGLKQATTKGPSLRIADTTKPFRDENERFNCMLGEYLHHFVDGRQRNWAHLLNVAQIDHSAQTESLIKRSLFETDGKRHSVFPPFADDPYVGNKSQVH
ncbi:uncharacterized protein E5676_scaffold227G00710 [Cucumis melo var. makuwa]|uniref:Reverse transcriptase n=1 Tax=Cucumis melo var. makuwa TaxID=1194695 RepID=A0A5D3CLC7_CUCMM|nr:uncharacterized protein E6C27_scaffold84G00050 [Cucumis melo var. makuwa]TYK11226.1 uncharacterized protein E5676_scaffold227G00710 [Cucumis melo var. makuwa]